MQVRELIEQLTAQFPPELVAAAVEQISVDSGSDEQATVTDNAEPEAEGNQQMDVDEV